MKAVPRGMCKTAMETQDKSILRKYQVYRKEGMSYSRIFICLAFLCMLYVKEKHFFKIFDLIVICAINSFFYF